MTAHRSSLAPSRLRTLVQGGVLVLVAVGLTQTWLINGLAVPYRVAGGSMAGTLLGMHRNVVCGDCGCPFACGTEVLPAAARAVCLNCGYAGNDLESLPDVGGDYVLIDRTAFSARAPRRWEIVAFRQSSPGRQESSSNGSSVYRVNRWKFDAVTFTRMGVSCRSGPTASPGGLGA